MSVPIPTNEPSTEAKAWILITASSAACILGSFVVFVDVIWGKLFPGNKFQFQDNKQVMVASLSLSSGVLLFTSMYRLLPEALEYFQSSPELKGNPQLANMVLIGSYIIGILICAGFNGIIHALTSQSVVHCVHGEEGEDDIDDHDGERIISSGHAHNHDPELGHRNYHHHHHHHHHDHQNHSHDFSHSNHIIPASPPCDPEPAFKNLKSNPAYGTIEEESSPGDESISLSSSSISNETPEQYEETSRLLEQQIISTTNSTDNNIITTTSTTILESESRPIRPLLPARKISLLDITQTTLRGQKTMGVCMGYTTIDQCLYSKCCNLNEEDPTSQTIIIPPIEEVDNDVYPRRPSVHRNMSQHSLHSTHSEHPQFHHHHVISQYSQLFSIGIQTALAITVHKIPEGILTYATYHADQSLGFSVFLALAIHNFSEGFAIVFPLFLATQNRLIAFSIAALLGGISQPLGALIAWLFFKNKFTNESTSLTFGLIVSLTAGFMSIIGLQMYGTSIAFGGAQSVTLTWAFLGVTLVGVTACLI